MRHVGTPSAKPAAIRVCGLLAYEKSHAPGATYALHGHSEPYIDFFIAGTQIEKTSSSEIHAQGDVTLTPAGREHSLAAGEFGFVCFTVELGATFLERDDYALRLPDRMMVFPGAQGTSLLAAARRRFLAGDEVALFEQVVELLGKCTPTEASSRAPSSLPRVYEAIHDCFRERLTLERLARIAQLHPAYLSQVFRSVYGCNISDAIKKARVAEAARLLQRGDLTPGEVALEVGFADQAHLTRVFGECFGFTPAAYRRLFSRPS